jgi:2-polyprenyl-3-methyl-5-hydroxy-6-metoxy-1,4-benzoquinol methylase
MEKRIYELEITEKEFWEKYWGDIKLPQKVNFNFKNDRVIANTILRYIPKATKDKTALEIGCAPGKWLVFIYEKLGYKIEGFEYVDIASKKTVENCLLSNIPKSDFNILTADFLTQTPEAKYDLVVSLGFIEHFENYKDIFYKHLLYTKKGGYIVIGFPSFRGLNYYIQLFIDKISGSKIIENHNISMMNIDLMREMLEKRGKKILYLDYIGGFESALFNVNNIKNRPLRFIIKVYIRLLSYIFMNIKNKYISSYLIFVLKND